MLVCVAGKSTFLGVDEIHYSGPSRGLNKSSFVFPYRGGDSVLKKKEMFHPYRLAFSFHHLPENGVDKQK